MKPNGKPQGWKAERDFPSREYAAAWHAQILWSQEWHRRSTTGPEMPMDAICRKAEELAKHARLADMPEAGRVLDQYGGWTLEDLKSDQPESPDSRRLARDMARSLCPLRHAQAVEHEIDLLISDADGSAGEGR